jgi:hypothetical protein
MCLSKIDNHYKRNEGFGWKIYLEDKNGQLYSLLTRDVVLEDEWMLAEDKGGQKVPNSKSYIGQSFSYTKGFHIYEYEPSQSDVTAIEMDWANLIPKDYELVVKRVAFKDVIKSGIESRYFPVAMGNIVRNVIVANKIKVLTKNNINSDKTIEVSNEKIQTFSSP